MKILQVVHGFPPENMAGTEVYSYNLSRELAKRHQVFVFHRTKDVAKREFLVERREADGLHIISINHTFRTCDSFEAIYKNEPIARAFGRLLDDIQPDVVHIQHLLFLGFQLLEEIAVRKIAVVFTLHDYFLICPQGQFLKKDVEVCKSGCGADCVDCVTYQLSINRQASAVHRFLKHRVCSSLLRLAKQGYLQAQRSWPLFRKRSEALIRDRAAYIQDMCSGVDIFLSPSLFLKERFAESGIARERILHARIGLDSGPFQGSKKSVSQKMRFGFIGTLIPSKGVRVLVEAFCRFKNDNVELKIFGEDRPANEDAARYIHDLKKAAQGHNIHFMGGFDNRRIAEVFDSIDVLVVPSIWWENSPLVIQEAFLAQTPVIASAIGGMPELVIDRVNGLLFKPGDPQDLFDKMQLLIDKPDLMSKLKDGIRPVRTIEEDARVMERLYQDILQGKT